MHRKQINSTPMNNSAVNFRPERKRRCKVLYSYQPLNDDELSLEIEDVVEILEEVEEGWWKGFLKGKVGVFPSNFVEEVPVVEEQEIITTSPDKQSLNSEVKSKSVKEAGYGNIFQDGLVKLKPTAPVATVPPTNIVLYPKAEKSVRKSTLTPSVPSANDAPELPPKKAFSISEQARVLFSYEAQNDDELTLKEGDIVNVLSKVIEDKGWWKGELNGTVGVFPDNFVQLIASSDELRPKKPDRLEKDQNMSKNKIQMDKKNHVDGGSSVKETSEIFQLKTSSLTRGTTTKSVTSEISKKAIDEKVEKFDKMGAPPLPSKKPLLPPPMKKVATPTHYRNFEPPSSSSVPPPPIITNANSKHVPDNDKFKGRDSPSNEVDLDRIESSPDKLVHLTANRAKNPNRRPPSHIFLKGENDKLNGELKNSNKLNKVKNQNLDSNRNVASHSLVKDLIPEVEENSMSKDKSRISGGTEVEIPSSKVTIDGLKRPSPLPSPGKTKSINPGNTTKGVTKVEKSLVNTKPDSGVSAMSTTTPDGPQLSELSAVATTKVNSVKENSDTGSEHLKLRQELAELSLQFELFKNLTNRHISELSNEVKAEKDKRLILQAEMDTLKIQLQRK